MEKEVLVHTLLYGFRIPANKAELSIEEKLMVIISKQLRDFTLITDNERDYRREVNLRGVMLAANKSGVEPYIIKEYYETFHEQIIYMAGRNQELESYLQKEGLTQIRPLEKEVGESSYGRRSIILTSEQEISSVQGIQNIKYLVYSLESLRVGPLLIPGTTICIHCYEKNEMSKNRDVEIGYPMYYRSFILNFLVNSIYFSLNDIHKYLGTDVGLPIRKCFQLSNPELSISVTNFYKTSECSSCF